MPYVWKLNIFLRNTWVKDESISEIRKYFILNYKNIIEQKLWDAAIVVLRRKYIILNVYARKEEWLKIKELINLRKSE